MWSAGCIFAGLLNYYFFLTLLCYPVWLQAQSQCPHSQSYRHSFPVSLRGFRSVSLPNPPRELSGRQFQPFMSSSYGPLLILFFYLSLFLPYFPSCFLFLWSCLFYVFYSFLLIMTHIVFLHFLSCLLVLTHLRLGFGLTVEFRLYIFLSFLLLLGCQNTLQTLVFKGAI